MKSGPPGAGLNTFGQGSLDVEHLNLSTKKKENA